MQSQFHPVTFEEYCSRWELGDYLREEDRSEFAAQITAAGMFDLAATLHADALQNKGDVAMKRRAAEAALRLAGRLTT